MAKTLKKLLIVVLALCMTVFCGVLAAACDHDGGETVAVTGITLSKTELALDTGANETLTATVAPTDATNNTVSWYTSDAAVATVVDGKVTAVAPGVATIIAAADSKVATCKVTVSDPFNYAAGWPDLENGAEATPGDRDSGDFEIPHDFTTLEVGTTGTKIDISRSVGIEWDTTEVEAGSYMLRLAYEAEDYNVTDDYLRMMVYFVGVTTDAGETWTYQTPPTMGGIMTGLNITDEITKVRIVVQYTGDGTYGDAEFAQDVYAFIIVNNNAH